MRAPAESQSAGRWRVGDLVGAVPWHQAGCPRRVRVSRGGAEQVVHRRPRSMQAAPAQSPRSNSPSSGARAGPANSLGAAARHGRAPQARRSGSRIAGWMMQSAGPARHRLAMVALARSHSSDHSPLGAGALQLERDDALQSDDPYERPHDRGQQGERDNGPRPGWRTGANTPCARPKRAARASRLQVCLRSTRRAQHAVHAMEVRA